MRSADHGFTMIEVLVTGVIVSVLASISGFTFYNEINRSEQRGSTMDLVSWLRSAATQSVSEGRTYCVALASAPAPAVNRTYTTWRFSCGGVGSVMTRSARSTQSGRVSFTSTSTLPPPPAVSPCPAQTTCIYFYPRGTATPASISVRSTRRSQVQAISVQGLTARVF